MSDCIAILLAIAVPVALVVAKRWTVDGRCSLGLHLFDKWSDMGNYSSQTRSCGRCGLTQKRWSL